MNDQSLGRVVKVRVFASIIGDVLGIPQIAYDKGYTEFSSIQPDGTQGFRIRGKAVQVQPTVGFNTNQITLALYNLGPDSRAIIQSKIGTRLSIVAGYQKNEKQIALGDILWARTHKEGADYITEIVAGDSHFALTSGKVNISFSGSVSFKQVVDTLISALKDCQIFAGVLDVPDGSYQSGIVLNRSPLEELADVCKKMGRVMSVVGGSVNILKQGADLGNPAIEVSTETGMIGIPEMQPHGQIGVVPTGVPVSPDLDLSFVHLLRADLTLSQKVRIKSKFINGEYTILRNVFDFDSWGGPFYNRCECCKVLTNE